MGAASSAAIEHLAPFLREPRRILDEGLSPSENVRALNRVLLTGWLLMRALKEAQLTRWAAATSYTLVFSLIPLLATTLAFLTAFPGLAGEKGYVSGLLFRYLLPGAVLEVQRHLEQFSARAAQTGAISSVVFIVIVLLLFNSVERVFNDIWKIERNRTWTERLEVLAVAFVVGAMAVTLMIATTRELIILSSRYEDLAGGWSVVQRYALQLLNLFVAWIVFAVANKVLPNVHVRWGPAIAGALLAGTVWHILKAVFTWYVEDIATYQNVYGALGVVPAFFLWAYLSMLLLMVSGYISFVLQNFRALVARERLDERGQPQLAWFAVAAAATLARAYKERRGPITAEQLAVGLGVAEYFLTVALQPLRVAGLVIDVAGVTGTRWMLAIPAEQLTVAEIVRLVAGEDLQIPDAAKNGPLHHRLARLFDDAKRNRAEPLERVTVADLMTEGAPSP